LANILDKFKDIAIGSSGRVLDFIAKISSRGDFSKLFDVDVIINSWNNILITPKGSADHDPEYGSNLYLYIFEPADNNTKDGIVNELKSSLMTFDNRASIDDAKISFLRNSKGFRVDITVKYAGNKSNMTLNMDRSMYESYL